MSALALALAALRGQAVDFHVATAQELQNALTLAAANGADNRLFLASGYYIGNFNYNSSGANNLTLLGEAGITNTAITIDGGGTGIGMSLSSSANANITVQGLTFLRKGADGLRIATGGGGNVTNQNCLFLSPPGNDGPGLEIASGQNATVLGCTAAGTGSGGRGIFLHDLTANATVQNCLLTTNASGPSGGGQDGGGLYVVASGVVTVLGNSFLGNSVPEFWSCCPSCSPRNGGGALCYGATVLLSGNSFTGNRGGYCGGNGVAAYCYGSSTLTASNNTFTANLSGSQTLYLSGGSVTLLANTFVNNGQDGAGVSGNPVSILNNTFVNNSGLGINAGGPSLTCSGNSFIRNSYGGANLSASASGSGRLLLTANNFLGNGNLSYGSPAAQCWGDQLTITGNTFTGNTCTYQGGGLSVYSSFWAAITGNTFTGNACTGSGGGGQGGAIWEYCPNCILTNSANHLTQNTASQTGAGIYAQAAIIEMTDNLIANNSQGAGGSSGGGIWVNPTALLDMVNNTITGNSTPGNGGGVVFSINGLSEILHVYNNIIWGNSATGNGGDVYLAGTGQQKLFLYNDVDALYGVWDLAQNNLDVAPQFFDPVNGDYHLRPTSLCANVGTNCTPLLPLTDLDGNARTNAAGQVDLGCYEFNNTATHPADTNAAFVLTLAEFNAYAAAWKSGQSWSNAPSVIPADYVTRAGYLMTNGGVYHNDGSARPVNWKPGL